MIFLLKEKARNLSSKMMRTSAGFEYEFGGMMNIQRHNLHHERRIIRTQNGKIWKITKF